MKSDPNLVNQIGQTIWNLLDQHSGGCVDREAVKEIEQLTAEARRASDYDPYVCETTSAIGSFAKILYSARKHQEYQNHNQSGPETLRDIIRSDLERIKAWEGAV